MHQSNYIGVCENRDDPLELGRIQVRVFGVHSESLDDVPTKDLPWAIPLMPATSASLSGIGHSPTQYLEGTFVSVYFQDGESKQFPIILGSFHGIPLNASPFPSSSRSGVSVTASGIDTNNNVTSVVNQPTQTNSDSNGTPVSTPAPTPVPVTQSGSCCSDVDTTKMVAQFGSNVTLVCSTLCDFGIKNSFAIIAILANIAKECKFKPTREGMNYSSVVRLRQIFPSKFRDMSDSDASQYVNNESKLANFVYANSDGNGSVESGDGYKYRGGGFIQLTKKNNYSSVGSKIGVDLVSNPDQVNDPSVAAKVVAQYFVNRFGGASRLNFSSLDDALQTVTKKVNPGGFSNDYPKVVKYAALCSTSKTPDQVSAEEQKKDLTKPNNQTTSVDTSKSPTDISRGISRANTASSDRVGFKDPNGKYPLKSLLKEPDTNRLSRRNIQNTLVQNKNENRRTGIKSIGSEFSEPLSPYNAKYPFNQVYFSESGHALEFDDTPDNERVHLYHTSGTYSEVDKFGNQVNKIVGDSFSITESNGYVYIDGTARVTVGGSVKLVIGGDLDISVDGNVNWDVGGSVNWKVGGDNIVGVGGKNSIRSSGITAIDSSQIYWNSGRADSVQTSARSGSYNDYEMQVPESFKGSTPDSFDDVPESESEPFHTTAVSTGVVTKKELKDGETMAKTPEKVDEKTPPQNTAKAIPGSCEAFSGKTGIPDSTQISKRFTLGMVSSKAAVSHYKVANQGGLSESEIVCNLKQVAENCLDPIKEKYSNMFVTSGFRTGSGTSQHLKGQAIDMQFTGASKSDYFDIAGWIRDNVLFDQLLLEYKTTGSGLPWIHISFNGSGNRKQVLTFMNDKNVGPGLRKLQ